MTASNYGFAPKLALALVGLAVVVWVAGRLFPRLKPSRQRLGSLALLGGSLGLSVVLGEFIVREVYADVTTTSDNSSYFARKWRTLHPISQNSLGYREREIGPKPDSVYRIAFVGDSFTYGQGLLEPDRVTEQLAARLLERAEGRRFEVLNFGRPGAETIDEIGTLENDVFGVDPDFVLVQWYVNDVEGADRSGRPRPARLVPSDGLTALLHQRSALYYLLNRGWQGLQSSMGWLPSYDDYLRERFGNENGAEWVRAAGELELLFETVQVAGIPYGLLLFPELAEVGSPTDASSSFLIDRVLVLCEKHSVECVDLRPVLAAQVPVAMLWANPLDQHPGPLANELAVEAVLDSFLPEWLQAVGPTSP